MTARVTLLTTNLARGGAETQVAQLAAGLRRRDWDVSVVSMLTPTAFEQELGATGVPVFSLNMQPGAWNPLGYPRLLGVLRTLRPQVLHGHMFHANALARAARLFCPVPVVISTLHSAAESGRASKKVRWRDLCYRLTDPLGDLTVAVAQAVSDRHVSARAVRSSKLRVIPNGVDTDRFRPASEKRERVRRALGLGREFAWLAVGRLMWKKGYGTLLEAFTRLRGGVLLIAGSGGQETELRHAAGENVRFLGQRDDVAELMSACDGFVQASVVEGLPVALLEAAASGLPCVATDAGGAGEVGTAHLVPYGDPESLARAMMGIMSLPVEERTRLGMAGREQVVARFDMKVVLGMWEELYREMLTRWT